MALDPFILAQKAANRKEQRVAQLLLLAKNGTLLLARKTARAIYVGAAVLIYSTLAPADMHLTPHTQAHVGAYLCTSRAYGLATETCLLLPPLCSPPPLARALRIGGICTRFGARMTIKKFTLESYCRDVHAAYSRAANRDMQQRTTCANTSKTIAPPAPSLPPNPNTHTHTHTLARVLAFQTR